MTGVVASDPSEHRAALPLAQLRRLRLVRAYQDPAFDKMWDDAAAELDRDTRLEQYEDIQLYIMENALTMPDAGDRAQQLLCRQRQGRAARRARHLPLAVRHLHRAGLTGPVR